MINTERNRALLTDLFAALGREGWGEVFLVALRDDVVFNCSVPHSHSDASATKSDSPNDVNAYSTPGGTSLKSRHDAIRFHLLEMLDHHLLADPLHHTAQFSEAACFRQQRPYRIKG